MAGNYMDAPGSRLAWDRDGSVLISVKTTGPVILTEADRQRLNNETYDASATVSGLFLCVVFPRKVDLKALMFNGMNSAGMLIQVSKNSTNGEDGTWTTITSGETTAFDAGPVVPFYREAVNLITWTLDSSVNDVVAVRIGPGGGQTITSVSNLHLYGDTPPETAGDALMLWQPTLNLPVTPTWFDFGDVGRGSTEDRTFRIKNTSASKAAVNVSLFMHALTVTTPSQVDDFLFSNDGTTFQASYVLPSIAAGVLTGVYTLRRVTPSNAALSVCSARIIAEAESWS